MHRSKFLSVLILLAASLVSMIRLLTVAPANGASMGFSANLSE